jgi:RHS repeat-associated protein
VTRRPTSGSATRTTYTLGDVVLGQQSASQAGGSAVWFVSDGHGSTRMLTNSTGAVLTAAQTVVGGSAVKVLSFDAYGNALGFDASTTATNVLYSGQLFDKSTGLQYLRARYYGSSFGGFTQTDPFSGYLRSPGTLSGYHYAGGNPVNWFDPSGLMGFPAGLDFMFGAQTYAAGLSMAITSCYYFHSAVQEDLSGASAGVVGEDLNRAGGYLFNGVMLMEMGFNGMNVALKRPDIPWPAHPSLPPETPPVEPAPPGGGPGGAPRPAGERPGGTPGPVGGRPAPGGEPVPPTQPQPGPRPGGQTPNNASPPGGLPDSNASWGRNRLTHELHDRGFVLEGPSDSGGGLIYRNSQTGESVRIMPRPDRVPFRNEPPGKFENDYYYRYQPNANSPEGPHITLPNPPVQNR